MNIYICRRLYLSSKLRYASSDAGIIAATGESCAPEKVTKFFRLYYERHGWKNMGNWDEFYYVDINTPTENLEGGEIATKYDPLFKQTFLYKYVANPYYATTDQSGVGWYRISGRLVGEIV